MWPDLILTVLGAEPGAPGGETTLHKERSLTRFRNQTQNLFHILTVKNLPQIFEGHLKTAVIIWGQTAATRCTWIRFNATFQQVLQSKHPGRFTWPKHSLRHMEAVICWDCTLQHQTGSWCKLYDPKRSKLLDHCFTNRTAWCVSATWVTADGI